MRKVVLYLGMSLDGYIADKNGGVGWMEEDDTGSLEDRQLSGFCSDSGYRPDGIYHLSSDKDGAFAG